MKFYGILCALVALALLLTPAIAMKERDQSEKETATGVGTAQTTVAETVLQTESVTTDGE